MPRQSTKDSTVKVTIITGIFGIVIVLISAIIGPIIVTKWSNIAPAPTVVPSQVTTQPPSQTSPTPANTLTVVVPSGKLVINDLLKKANYWKGDVFNTNSDKGFCVFGNGGYDITATTSGYKVKCPGPPMSFSDFTFQVQMTIIKGDCGGIFFRANLGTPQYYSRQYYYFHVCQNGSYDLFRYDDEDKRMPLLAGTSTAIVKGFDQPNLIQVKTQGDKISLYVKNQLIGSPITDSTYSAGQIGLVAADGTHETEVVFSNAKVWS